MLKKILNWIFKRKGVSVDFFINHWTIKSLSLLNISIVKNNSEINSDKLIVVMSHRGLKKLFFLNAMIFSPIIGEYPIRIPKLMVVFDRFSDPQHVLIRSDYIDIEICKHGNEYQVVTYITSLDNFKMFLGNNLTSELIKSINYSRHIKLYALIYDRGEKMPKCKVAIDPKLEFNISNIIKDSSKEYLRRSLLFRNHLSKEYYDFSKIPLVFAKMIIAAEDPLFYQHCGICVESLISSIGHIFKHRCLGYGGSSITQQLIKNSILTNKRTICRKVEEAILSLLFENNWKLSKESIFELYFNMVEMGGCVFGIGDASKHFLRKSVKDLRACPIIYVNAEVAYLGVILVSA